MKNGIYMGELEVHKYMPSFPN